MRNMENKVNYVEFATLNMAETQRFFTAVFGWTFQNFGTEYTAFSNQGVDGGFYTSDKISTSDAGGALVVFYAQDLSQTQAKIEAAGGTIVKPIFSFPGGQRFHFKEPGGNELAVWSDAGSEPA